MLLISMSSAVFDHLMFYTTFSTVHAWLAWDLGKNAKQIQGKKFV